MTEKRTNKSVFIPLGGGDHVGASCYYLKIAGYHMILDAGAYIVDGYLARPDLMPLLKSGHIESLGQIDVILLSHAHFDHVGSYADLSRRCPNAVVLTTRMTKNIMHYSHDITGNKKHDSNGTTILEKSLSQTEAFDRIQTVSYLSPYAHNELRITFYASGHIPGAAMILIEALDSCVLYTGDFSHKASALTSGYAISKSIQGCLDTMIMCGLHARNPFHRSDYEIANIIRTIEENLEKYRILSIESRELTKNIELLTMLNHAVNEGVIEPIDIYLDDYVFRLIEYFELEGLRILYPNNQRMHEKQTSNSNRVIYLGKYPKNGLRKIKKLSVIFSLHIDYTELKRFIKEVDPKRIYVVHQGKQKDTFLRSFEKDLPVEYSINPVIVYTEDGITYLF